MLDASNAGEALLVCEQRRDTVHLVLTDVIMPRMTGPQLAARVRSLRPEMRVVYISGYSEDRLDAPDAASSHHGFLAKPVSVQQLLRRVREALLRCVAGRPLPAREAPRGNCEERH